MLGGRARRGRESQRSSERKLEGRGEGGREREGAETEIEKGGREEEGGEGERERGRRDRDRKMG